MNAAINKYPYGMKNFLRGWACNNGASTTRAKQKMSRNSKQ